MGLLIDIFSVPLMQIFATGNEQILKYGLICMISQCIALPIHAWVATVNMLCVGLGNAKGAFVLATSRQGSCFLPILYPLAWIFGAYGLCSVQAVADIVSLVFAIPLAISMTKKIKQAMAETTALPV